MGEKLHYRAGSAASGDQMLLLVCVCVEGGGWLVKLIRTGPAVRSGVKGLIRLGSTCSQRPGNHQSNLTPSNHPPKTVISPYRLTVNTPSLGEG